MYLRITHILNKTYYSLKCPQQKSLTNELDLSKVFTKCLKLNLLSIIYSYQLYKQTDYICRLITLQTEPCE